MNSFFKFQRRHGRAGFTLVEMMFTLLIFSVVVGAIVGLQLFSSRLYVSGASKVRSSSNGREAMNVLRDRIRSAKIVYVGNYDPTSGSGFAQTASGTLQQGNALEIMYANSLSTNYMIYYLDTATNQLRSFSNSVETAGASAVSVEASFVTNYFCFFAEDYQQNVLTDYRNNPVIRVVLQFYQWEYPIGRVGTNSLNNYDFYRLSTRVTRRSKQ